MILNYFLEIKFVGSYCKKIFIIWIHFLRSYFRKISDFKIFFFIFFEKKIRWVIFFDKNSFVILFLKSKLNFRICTFSSAESIVIEESASGGKTSTSAFECLWRATDAEGFNSSRSIVERILKTNYKKYKLCKFNN